MSACLSHETDSSKLSPSMGVTGIFICSHWATRHMYLYYLEEYLSNVLLLFTMQEEL